ncbi:MAG: glycosyltransferase family 4 protein [Ardenticatenaceae bacterium]|nr:glycosyltransferase family 4 protein [Ardenticatenaceae bacterium]
MSETGIINSLPLAFVTPWYGEIPGGAETETRRTAEHLAAAGFKVEVLTTCIRDFHSNWDENHHRPGEVLINGVRVRRFAVEPCNRSLFQQLNWRVTNGLRLTADEATLWVDHMINSPTLLDFLQKYNETYLFFFIPYLFTTTIQGVHVAPQRSFIIPCLHDEPAAYLPPVQQALQTARGLIFNANAEHQLLKKMGIPVENQSTMVIGTGIDVEKRGRADAFRKKYSLTDPFIFYIGRRAEGKNTPLLISYWADYVRSHRPQAKLVLAGSGTFAVPEDVAESIVDLGFISEEEKTNAYAAASVVCQPSVNESFSIAIMDGWVQGKPALVHAHCPVTVEHCVNSNGGLYFASSAEFTATADLLLTRSTLREQLGANGRHYVVNHFRWETIVAHYSQIVNEYTYERR